MTLYKVKQPPFFNNFFNEFLDDNIHKPSQKNEPATNILEEESKFILELAVPGLTKEDFSISLDDKLLTISSVIEEEKKEEKINYNRQEFSYKEFSRSFSIPKSVNNESIAADYENGVLRIVLPKKPEEAKIKKQIAIN